MEKYFLTRFASDYSKDTRYLIYDEEMKKLATLSEKPKNLIEIDIAFLNDFCDPKRNPEREKYYLRYFDQGCHRDKYKIFDENVKRVRITERKPVELVRIGTVQDACFYTTERLNKEYYILKELNGGACLDAIKKDEKNKKGEKMLNTSARILNF